ncbi:MAG TPA: SDR family oxidoreductase [candidate division Zixibacteria bacterium]|nr:SDR family oxidoreductase [candidate division Zixibacteria bacterium]
MTRLLITGGSSYLGQHLVPKALERYSCRYTFFNRDPLELPEGVWLDARNKGAVKELIHEWRPQVIFHTAGSNRSDDMENVICSGAKNITDAAKGVGARLIHISSDVIFDGTQAPYRESDSPSPIHAYGRAKSEAERIVQDYENHVIIRTSLIYGLTTMDLSTEWIISTLRSGERITLFRDQIRNPVWVETLSSACLELCESEYTGILNVAGRQAMSRADLGLKMLNWWGIEERDNLQIGLSDSRWPADCRLDLSFSARLLSTPLLGVDEVLDEARG